VTKDIEKRLETLEVLFSQRLNVLEEWVVFICF
jgi:hypothetical protein